jgi:hypothetical protein
MRYTAILLILANISFAGELTQEDKDRQDAAYRSAVAKMTETASDNLYGLWEAKETSETDDVCMLAFYVSKKHTIYVSYDRGTDKTEIQTGAMKTNKFFKTLDTDSDVVIEIERRYSIKFLDENTIKVITLVHNGQGKFIEYGKAKIFKRGGVPSKEMKSLLGDYIKNDADFQREQAKK